MSGRRYSGVIKEKVQGLRSEGKTYTEIKRRLGILIPKSTLSNWCRNVSLPRWYADKVNDLNRKNLSKGQRLAWASNRLKRESLLNDLLHNNQHIVAKLADTDVLKMLLSVLYLGEGSRWRSHRGLMLGSSDPSIIRLYIRLLQLCYGIMPDELKCRVSYRADQDIQYLQRYWSRITNIPLKSFYRTIPDPRTVGRPTRRKEYKGVCVVSCGGTHIQLELEMIPKIILKGL